MARPIRTVAPGVPLHVVQRGNNRATCFFDTEDFDRYLRFLHRAAGEEHCRVHAYCLMSNHVHLLMTPEDQSSCARFMKVVNQRYAQHLNRIHERTGTPWEGRYRSNAVYSMRYVLACYRYIELNPLRAGIARHPADYPWSSYRTNAEGLANPLIRPHGTYAALGRDPETRRSAYRALVDEALAASLIANIRKAIGSGSALRDDPVQDFVDLSTGV